MTSIWGQLSRLESWTMEGYWAEYGDPRVRVFPGFDTIRPLMCLLLAYSLFVHLIGPRYMANREAYSLKSLLLIYNFTMVAINGYFLLYFLLHFGDTLERILNVKFPSFTETNESDLARFNVNYLYGCSKVIDLLDTVFFVLRKKQSQITLLHFYHHFSVPFFGWIGMRLSGQFNCCTLFMFLNTFLHILMYGYYGLAAMGPAVQRYLWWKRYITLLQILQFALLGCHWFYFILFQEGYPKFFLINYAVQTFLYIVLFTRFYLQAYTTKSSVKKVKSN